jgi:ribosome maturation factor RimP
VTVNEAVEAVRGLCYSILERRGYELVDVVLAREGRRTLLRVTVDHPEQSVGLQELSSISEEISRALDDLDPIDEAYTLEVSSAGIERPLMKPADYERFQGREAKVKTREPIEGRRNFQGTITRSGDETFVLDLGDQVSEIPYSSVVNAKLVVDWDEELRRSERKTG